MKNKELNLTFQSLPELIDSSFQMKEPNSKIPIYQGAFLLRNEKEEIEVIGEISFNWIPNTGVYFSGDYKSSQLGLEFFFHDEPDYKVLIDEVEIGSGFITTRNITFPNDGLAKLKGFINSKTVVGDKSISVSKLNFSIPNFREFRGNLAKKTIENEILQTSSRLSFEDETFYITIDQLVNYKKLKDSLEETGGYVILYGGEISCKKGSINLKSLGDYLHNINTFLSFLNGRRTSLMFIKGIYDGKTQWCDFSNFYVDSYKYVHSWPSNFSKENLNQSWNKFREIWKLKENNHFLTSLIHWYLEANNHSGFTDGAIIMAQTALELIYNWWIIENKKLILGKDSENLSAANKIRLVVSHLSIEYSSPNNFNHLSDFIRTTKNIEDVPDAIVYIRNSIIHSQEEKRKTLGAIHSMAKYETLQMMIWYIELASLRILEYNGKYYNRTSGKSTKFGAEENVPWIRKNELP
jgi:hypothetical protein